MEGMAQMKSMKEFEKILLETIDESMAQVFGNTSTEVIYDYLKGNHKLGKETIPENLEIFSSSLEKMFGFGAILLEKLVLKKFYTKLGLKYEEKEGYKFLDYIKELKSQILLDYMKEMKKKIS